MKKVDWQYLTDVLLFVSISAVVMVGFLLAFVIPQGPSAKDGAKYFLGLHRHEWGDIHLCLGIVFTLLALLHLMLGWKWIKGRTLGMFSNRWKTVFLAVSLLPFFVLAISWTLFPGRVAVKEQSSSAAVQPGSGVLQPGTLPPYHPTATIPAASPPAENQARISKEAIHVSFEPDRSADQEQNHRVVEYTDKEPGLTRGRGSEETSGILITGQMTLGDIERQTGVSARELSKHLGIPQDASLDHKLGRMRKRYGFSLQEVRDVTSTLIEQKDIM